MNLVIYKYPLEWVPEQWVPLPKGARILSVQTQSDGFDRFLRLWALVDKDQPVTSDRRILLRGTGTSDEISWHWRHLNTIVTDSGFVWHIFEDAFNSVLKEIEGDAVA